MENSLNNQNESHGKEILGELAQILRGDHPRWQGDRRANGCSFLIQVINTKQKSAIVLGQYIERYIDNFITTTGISPNTLHSIVLILQGTRQGAL